MITVNQCLSRYTNISNKLNKSYLINYINFAIAKSCNTAYNNNCNNSNISANINNHRYFSNAIHTQSNEQSSSIKQESKVNIEDNNDDLVNDKKLDFSNFDNIEASVPIHARVSWIELKQLFPALDNPKAFISRCPSVKLYHKKQIQLKIDELSKLLPQLDMDQIHGLIIREPAILRQNMKLTIPVLLSQIQSLLPNCNIHRIINKCPELLLYDTNSLKLKFDQINELFDGCEHKEFILNQQPRILTQSAMKSTASRLDLLVELTGETAENILKLAQYSPVLLIQRRIKLRRLKVLKTHKHIIESIPNIKLDHHKLASDESMSDDKLISPQFLSQRKKFASEFPWISVIPTNLVLMRDIEFKKYFPDFEVTPSEIAEDEGKDEQDIEKQVLRKQKQKANIDNYFDKQRQALLTPVQRDHTTDKTQQHDTTSKSTDQSHTIKSTKQTSLQPESQHSALDDNYDQVDSEDHDIGEDHDISEDKFNEIDSSRIERVNWNKLTPAQRLQLKKKQELATNKIKLPTKEKGGWKTDSTNDLHIKKYPNPKGLKSNKRSDKYNTHNKFEEFDENQPKYASKLQERTNKYSKVESVDNDYDQQLSNADEDLSNDDDNNRVQRNNFSESGSRRFSSPRNPNQGLTPSMKKFRATKPTSYTKYGLKFSNEKTTVYNQETHARTRDPKRKSKSNHKSKAKHY